LNIALYGFMGVGKTTIGKLLATRLNYEFIDMDTEIEKRMGMPISKIFQIHGEIKFRQIEAQLVEELSRRDRLVIACGGGAIADPDNAEALRGSAKMVYLTASIEEIIRRTSLDNSRPLLDVPNLTEVASSLLEKRKPIYLQYAEATVDTTGRTPDEIASTIMEELK
jgi:shikimate kinase